MVGSFFAHVTAAEPDIEVSEDDDEGAHDGSDAEDDEDDGSDESGADSQPVETEPVFGRVAGAPTEAQSTWNPSDSEHESGDDVQCSALVAMKPPVAHAKVAGRKVRETALQIAQPPGKRAKRFMTRAVCSICAETSEDLTDCDS